MPLFTARHRTARHLMLLACALAAAGSVGCTTSGGVKVFSAPRSINSAFPVLTAPQCAGIAVSPVTPGSVYKVPSGASGLNLECQVQAAYLGGATVVAFNADQAFIEQSFGDPNGYTINATTTLTSNVIPGPPALGPVPSPLPTLANAGAVPYPTGTPGNAVTLGQSVTAVVRASDGHPIFFSDAADSMSDVQNDLAAWQSSAAVLSSQSATPAPTSQLWNLVAEDQMFENPNAGTWYPNETKKVGSVGILTKVYRASTNDPTFDYFMSVTTMSSTPVYLKGVGNNCFLNCGYWTWARAQALTIQNAAGTDMPTLEVGPLNAVQVNKVSYSVGASLSGKVGWTGDKGASVEGNAGLNFGYSQSWDQPAASTVLTTTQGDTSAVWQDTTRNFMNPDFPSVWDAFAGGIFNIPTTVANYTNGRVAIFKVPRGDAYVQPRVDGSTYFRAGAVTLFEGIKYEQIQVRAVKRFTAWIPVFGVDTKSLTIARGTSATFRIQVKANPLEAPKRWVVVPDPNDQRLQITPSTGNDTYPDQPDPRFQTVTVFAQPTAVSGTRYTLYVNTVPAGGADSLRSGSLLITVTIQ